MIALRPWSFSASLTPVFLGSALAYKELYKHNQTFHLGIFFLTLIVALCVHGAGNLVNTYYDYKYGIDNENTVSDRTLVDKILKPEDITRLGVVLYFIGSMAFLAMLFFSPAKDEILAFIYFGGLSLSFMYTGGVGLKYMGNTLKYENNFFFFSFGRTRQILLNKFLKQLFANNLKNNDASVGSYLHLLYLFIVAFHFFLSLAISTMCSAFVYSGGMSRRSAMYCR